MIRGNQAAYQEAKKAALLNNDPVGVTTLVPLTNLPEIPSHTEGETLKAKSEGFQEDHTGLFHKEGLLFLPGNLNESWLTPYVPPLIYGRRPSKDY